MPTQYTLVTLYQFTLFRHSDTLFHHSNVTLSERIGANGGPRSHGVTIAEAM